MTRGTLVLISFALTMAVCPTDAPAEARLFTEIASAPGSLRGEAVDAADARDEARLLARFGERAAACDLLRRAARGDGMDPTAESLEARLLTEMGRCDAADSLLSLRIGAADARELYLHFLWRAKLNAACGRHERALHFVERLSELQDTLFDAHGDLVAVDALLSAGDAAAAVVTAKRRLSLGVPPSLGVEFESRLLEGYLRGGRAASALALLDSLKDAAPRRPAFAPLFAREVDVRLLLGDVPGAVRAATALANERDARAAGAAADSVLSRVPAESLPVDALLAFGEAMLGNNRASDAERLVAVLEGSALDESQREKRRLLGADLLYRKKRYAAAEREARAPFADASAERKAKLLRARIHRGAGERVKAAEAYEVFAKGVPYDAKAPEALYVAWDMQREAGNTARAARILGAIVETYPGHKYARLATLRIALDHAERREYTRGARILEEALERRGREDAAFLHYLAQIYGRMGRTDRRAALVEELTTLDPMSFYLNPEVPSPREVPRVAVGEGAGETGGRALRDFLETVLEDRERAYGAVARAVGAADARPRPGDAADCTARGRAFVEMGLRDWAEAEFRAAEAALARTPAEDLSLAAAYDEMAMPWRSVRAVQRVYYSLGREERRALDREFKLLAYPLPYPFLVLSESRRNGLAAHLVYAMMREESRFDDRAVSAAGAIGLMQIMPATGRQLAEEAGLPQGAGEKLLCPEINVSLGVRYAAELLERSGEDPLKMLAAYNAGLTRAARWFDAGKADRSPIERVDEIDFWETREYVKRIVESARVYYSLYFPPSPSGL